MKFVTPNINLRPSGSESGDDDLSNANTEDDLINASSQTSITTIKCCQIDTEQIPKTCSWFACSVAIVLLMLGTASVVYPLTTLMMDLRLDMTPGLPPFEWWKNPPDEVLFRVYIFNISNSRQFINGEEEKLNFHEIGPIVFMEKLVHSNVTFNQNDTLTYTASRKAVYLPDLNTIDLNATLVVPNLAVLGIASYLSDAPFFAKFGLNLLIRRLDSQPLKNITIYDFLFNNTDPLLDLSEKVVPSMVPTNNLGILHEIYRKFTNVVTVYIGRKNGHEKFFLIDRYDGSDVLPGYNKRCTKTIKNTTEGVSYPQYITKRSVLKYWRRTLCKDVDLHYESSETWNGINSYKFALPPSTYFRTKPLVEDCFQGSPTLPNGVVDVSPCYYDLPVAASFPHFLHADPELLTQIDGLTPNASLHESFVLIEPITGIPLHSKARSQSSLVVKSMSGFTSRLQPFGDKILPLFYIEYNQVGLPWYIYVLLYSTVNVLPIFEKVFSGICILLGVLILAIFIRKKRKLAKHLLENKKLQFERETFLKV